jgi:hypothetical protein
MHILNVAHVSLLQLFFSYVTDGIFPVAAIFFICYGWYFSMLRWGDGAYDGSDVRTLVVPYHIWYHDEQMTRWFSLHPINFGTSRGRIC